MRTDAIIDKRQVRCPNASHLGYDKWKAQVGDLITFREGDHGITTGRMIGRIHYAPPCGESPAINNWLLVIGINSMLDHTFERWANPADVTRVQSLREQQAVMGYFLSDEILKAPIEEVRRGTTDGWTTLSRYRAYTAERDKAQAEYESRKAGA